MQIILAYSYIVYTDLQSTCFGASGDPWCEGEMGMGVSMSFQLSSYQLTTCTVITRFNVSLDVSNVPHLLSGHIIDFSILANSLFI